MSGLGLDLASASPVFWTAILGGILLAGGLGAEAAGRVLKGRLTSARREEPVRREQAGDPATLEALVRVTAVKLGVLRGTRDAELEETRDSFEEASRAVTAAAQRVWPGGAHPGRIAMSFVTSILGVVLFGVSVALDVGMAETAGIGQEQGVAYGLVMATACGVIALALGHVVKNGPANQFQRGVIVAALVLAFAGAVYTFQDISVTRAIRAWEDRAAASAVACTAVRSRGGSPQAQEAACRAAAGDAEALGRAKDLDRATATLAPAGELLAGLSWESTAAAIGVWILALRARWRRRKALRVVLERERARTRLIDEVTRAGKEAGHQPRELTAALASFFDWLDGGDAAPAPARAPKTDAPAAPEAAADEPAAADRRDAVPEPPAQATGPIPPFGPPPGADPLGRPGF